MRIYCTFIEIISLANKPVKQSKSINFISNTTIAFGLISEFTLSGAIKSLGRLCRGFTFLITLALSSAPYLPTMEDKRVIRVKLFDSLETSNCVSLYNTNGSNVYPYNSRLDEEIIKVVGMKTLIYYTRLVTYVQSRFKALLIKYYTVSLYIKDIEKDI